MSLSRPVKFPLLKLPFLCIKCVIHNSDLFDIIYFALLSKRTRRIVKHLKIPLNNIKIYLSDDTRWINFDNYSKMWYFCMTREKYFGPQSEDLRKDPLVLQNNAIPMYTSKTDDKLHSYTDGSTITALKVAMEFLDEVFKCSVQKVDIDGDNYPESGEIGVKSTVDINVEYVEHSRKLGQAEYQKLNLLLENLEVTGECRFRMSKTEMDFHCDPKLLKCKKFEFWSFGEARISMETLLQFEVPQLRFNTFMISAEDIVSFITQWFHSDNKKLEYLYIFFSRERRIPLQKFQTKELNPVPFEKRTRVPSSESLDNIDFSKGLEIVRHDGLVATIHANNVLEDVLFYIWHDQPDITQE